MHLPTLLEFTGYLHFFGGSLFGPFIEYWDYINWAELKGPYKELPFGNFKNLKPCLTRLAQGILCITIYTVMEYFVQFDLFFKGR